MIQLRSAKAQRGKEDSIGPTIVASDCLAKFSFIMLVSNK